MQNRKPAQYQGFKNFSYFTFVTWTREGASFHSELQLYRTILMVRFA